MRGTPLASPIATRTYAARTRRTSTESAAPSASAATSSATTTRISGSAGHVPPLRGHEGARAPPGRPSPPNASLANSRRRATCGSRPALLFARASEAVGLSDCVCPEAVGFCRAWTAVSPDGTVTSGLTPRGPREWSGAEGGSGGGCVSGEAQRDRVACRCGCMRARGFF
jgi:hypothetical protein